MVESQGKRPNIVKKCVLIADLKSAMKEPDKLKSLLNNASRNGLNKCRAPGGGWYFVEVVRWMLLEGHLKPEISEKHIDTLIEQAVNNS